MKYKRQKSSLSKRALSLTTLGLLEDLFNSKHWEINHSSSFSLFERFSCTLSMLTEEEQKFILELTHRFQKYSRGCYLTELADPIKKLRALFPNEYVFFVPCVPEEDLKKTKSSNVTLYDLKETQYSIDLGRHKIEVNDIANQKSHIGEKSVVVLVDDFIGTGETALGAIKYMHKVIGEEFPHKNVAVLSIAAMQQGIQRIEELGIHVFTNHIFKKGISDYYTGKDCQNAIEIMQGIEKKINRLKPEYRFGYKQSESLVCMSRCPNNTFPIYWLGKNTAPYER